MAARTIVLTHSSRPSLFDVVEVARGTAKVRLATATVRLLQERRDQVERFVSESGTSHYGFNSGFGHNRKLSVTMDRAAELQCNLIRSHASGVGEPLPKEVVRAAMFLRAASLARGHSGVRPVVVQRLLDLLDADLVPIVPRFGSVGASGDLAPLSHIALAMMGEGQIWVNGSAWPAGEALQKAGIEPLDLKMKEGLALNNGVQVSTAIGFLALDRMRSLVRHAVLATALSAQVLLGADTPFRRGLQLLRPHPGAVQVAAWLHQLMQSSPIREEHRLRERDAEIQDPYSVRCAPQILGSCVDLLDDALRTLEIEAGSVTDNPCLLPLTEENARFTEFGSIPRDRRKEFVGQFVDIVSGGHFHGMPIAIRLYGLIQAAGIVARLSNLRVQRYVDEARNKGLGPDLTWPDKVSSGTHSGMMVAEYVSASLTNWVWGSCMPTHLFSISTDAGQEDHVSMSAGLAVRLLETLPRLTEVVAVELAFASQARAIREYQRTGRQPGRVALLSPPTEAVVRRIWDVFPPLTHDEPLSSRLKELADLVRSDELLQTAGDRLREFATDEDLPLFPDGEPADFISDGVRTR